MGGGQKKNIMTLIISPLNYRGSFYFLIKKVAQCFGVVLTLIISPLNYRCVFRSQSVLQRVPRCSKWIALKIDSRGTCSSLSSSKFSISISGEKKTPYEALIPIKILLWRKVGKNPKTPLKSKNRLYFRGNCLCKTRKKCIFPSETRLFVFACCVKTRKKCKFPSETAENTQFIIQQKHEKVKKSNFQAEFA